MAADRETVSRPQPSRTVEFKGIAYTLGTVIEKVRRAGVPLPQSNPQVEAERLRDNPWLRGAMDEGPCVCCHAAVPEWPSDHDWPWAYMMGGGCLCIACYGALWKVGVRPLPWDGGVGDVQTVRDGVRIAPEPGGGRYGYEDIARLVGRPVSAQEVVWANLGALSGWGKPLGDVVEGLWEAGTSLTPAEFERLVQRGREA